MGKKKKWIASLLIVGFLVWFSSNLSAAEEAKKENIKLGPIYLGLNAGLSLRWTDNIGLTSHDTDSDWAATASLGLGINCPLTQNVLLGLDANFGYTRWADHDEVEGGLVGTSALNFDFPVAGWKINVHDRYTRATDPVSAEQPFIDSATEFTRSNNTAGIAFSKDFNKVKLGFGYDLISYRTEESKYKDWDRDTQQTFVELAVALNPQADLFTRYTYAQNEPQTDLYNGSTSQQISAGLRGRITDLISGEVSIGYEQMNFDNEGLVTDEHDYDGVTYSAKLNHQITELTSHSIAVSYQPEYGYSTEANYYTWFNATYNITHRFTKKMNGHASYSYDNTEESRSGHKGEGIDRSIVGVGAAWQLNPKATFGVDYTYVDKNSTHEIFSHGYQQNNLTASLNYAF